MTRMTRPDCAVMCNLINTHTHAHTHTYTHINTHTHTHTHTLPDRVYTYFYDARFSETVASSLDTLEQGRGGGGLKSKPAEEATEADPTYEYTSVLGIETRITGGGGGVEEPSTTDLLCY